MIPVVDLACGIVPEERIKAPSCRCVGLELMALVVGSANQRSISALLGPTHQIPLPDCRRGVVCQLEQRWSQGEVHRQNFRTFHIIIADAKRIATGQHACSRRAANLVRVVLGELEAGLAQGGVNIGSERLSAIRVSKVIVPEVWWLACSGGYIFYLRIRANEWIYAHHLRQYG